MFVHELVYLLAETSVVVNNGAKVKLSGFCWWRRSTTVHS